MVGLLRGPPVIIWLDFYTLSSSRMVELLESPPGFRMVGLIEALRFKSGCFLRISPDFVWLYSLRPPGSSNSWNS